MFKRLLATTLAVTALLLVSRTARADDYTVPIILDDTTYTLTISLDGDAVSVTSTDDALVIGPVLPVIDEEESTAAASLNEQKANAATIDYDDLFRYNEDHVGKLVRYVGQVLQVEECQTCAEDLAVLRIAVTEDRFGLWDDPIWVEYMGPDRFLEDDIVTVWGIVEGLHTYETILGGTVTIPALTALDMVL
ncbi:MAG: hypothetical protein KDA37_06035, partial [Planctomycetales bacterium]|nr:hypothetical protein [Planctomycetales bacterium]